MFKPLIYDFVHPPVVGTVDRTKQYQYVVWVDLAENNPTVPAALAWFGVVGIVSLVHHGRKLNLFAFQPSPWGQRVMLKKIRGMLRQTLGMAVIPNINRIIRNFVLAKLKFLAYRFFMYVFYLPCSLFFKKGE
jgi:hypothetical protein